jgi:hypothetical protein
MALSEGGGTGQAFWVPGEMFAIEQQAGFFAIFLT